MDQTVYVNEILINSLDFFLNRNSHAPFDKYLYGYCNDHSTDNDNFRNIKASLENNKFVNQLYRLFLYFCVKVSVKYCR